MANVELNREQTKERAREILRKQITWSALAHLLVARDLEAWARTYVFTPELNAISRDAALPQAMSDRVGLRGEAVRFGLDAYELGATFVASANATKLAGRTVLRPPQITAAVLKVIARLMARFAGRAAASTAMSSAATSAAAVPTPLTWSAAAIIAVGDAALLSWSAYDLWNARDSFIESLVTALWG